MQLHKTAAAAAGGSCAAAVQPQQGSCGSSSSAEAACQLCLISCAAVGAVCVSVGAGMLPMAAGASYGLIWHHPGGWFCWVSSSCRCMAPRLLHKQQAAPYAGAWPALYHTLNRVCWCSRLWSVWECRRACLSAAVCEKMGMCDILNVGGWLGVCASLLCCAASQHTGVCVGSSAGAAVDMREGFQKPSQRSTAQQPF